MSTYEEICKQRCELCATRQPFANAIRRMRSRPIHTQPVGEYVSFLCTAPTPEQVIEEQAVEIARLRGLIAGMEHESTCTVFNLEITICSVCGVGLIFADDDEICETRQLHIWKTTPRGECSCSKSKTVKS